MSEEDSRYTLSDLPLEQLSYEQAFNELEGIVAALESEEHTLDMAMKLYERGQELAGYCAQLLEKADLKIQSLRGEVLEDFISPD